MTEWLEKNLRSIDVSGLTSSYGKINALRDEIIDLVGRRARIQALIERRIEAGQTAEARALIPEMD